MRHLVYPVVMFKDDESQNFIAKFPDVDVITEGASVEETFLNVTLLISALWRFVTIISVLVTISWSTRIYLILSSANTTW